MPTYFFDLKNAGETIRDEDGTDLPDEASARKHACLVAGELMRNREARTRFWQLHVFDNNRRASFQVLFADVDNSLQHLTPELRGSVEELCVKSAALCEMIQAVRLTLFEVRATLARSERAPYVAAINGQSIG
jgi:hypothetical protein